MQQHLVLGDQQAAAVAGKHCSSTRGRGASNVVGSKYGEWPLPDSVSTESPLLLANCGGRHQAGEFRGAEAMAVLPRSCRLAANVVDGYMDEPVAAADAVVVIFALRFCSR